MQGSFVHSQSCSHSPQEYALHLESANVPTLITDNVFRLHMLSKDPIIIHVVLVLFCGEFSLKDEVNTSAYMSKWLLLHTSMLFNTYNPWVEDCI